MVVVVGFAFGLVLCVCARAKLFNIALDKLVTRATHTLQAIHGKG